MEGRPQRAVISLKYPALTDSILLFEGDAIALYFQRLGCERPVGNTQLNLSKKRLMAKTKSKAIHTPIGIGKRWFDKDGAGKAAAVSFYTLFSAAPLLFFSLLISEHIVGQEQAKASAVTWLSGFISEVDASALVDMIHLQVWQGNTFWSTLVFALVLLWATSQVYVRLRLGIRNIIDEQAETAALAFKGSLIGRAVGLAVSAGMGVFAAAGFVLVSVLPSFTGVFDLQDWWNNPLFRNTWPAVLLTLGGVALIRWIPDRPPSWSATLRCSSFMLVAYTLGRLLLDIYTQHSTIVSAYGAASALVILLVWMYFSAQVFFFAVVLSHELDEENL